jgi:hypothetical protein
MHHSHQLATTLQILILGIDCQTEFSRSGQELDRLFWHSRLALKGTPLQHWSSGSWTVELVVHFDKLIVHYVDYC